MAGNKWWWKDRDTVNTLMKLKPYPRYSGMPSVWSSSKAKRKTFWKTSPTMPFCVPEEASFTTGTGRSRYAWRWRGSWLQPWSSWRGRTKSRRCTPTGPRIFGSGRKKLSGLSWRPRSTSWRASNSVCAVQRTPPTPRWCPRRFQQRLVSFRWPSWAL